MKKLFFILFAFILVGCGTTKDIVTVVNTKNILITPPDELLVKCDVESPPDVKEYMQASWQGKEELLITHSTSQMKNLFKCNNTMSALRDWKKKQIEIYSKEEVKK